MSRLFETILVRNGDPQHLRWHEQRMQRSALALFNAVVSFNLARDLVVPVNFGSGDMRCNVFYDPAICEIRFQAYQKKEISSLKMVVCDTANYPYKSADRSLLESLFQRREGCDDILIVKNGLLTDTSFANLLFTDGTRWFTPEQPLLPGTCRERMLSEKSILPIPIRVSDLPRFSGFRLINALRPAGEQETLPISNIR